MSGTNVARGSSLTLTHYSTAVTAQIIRAPGNLNALTGAPPKEADAIGNLKLQTSPGMPFVRITDLQAKGDKVTVDAFDVVSGKPIMGDRNAEGHGHALSSSTFDAIIDLATFNVDAGGKMARQRTKHNLRDIARASIQAYFPRLIWQRALVHLAGTRGKQTGKSWDIPLATDEDYAEIMVNGVQAPTYNRHLVIDEGSLVRGGAQLASIETGDVWTLANLDALAYLLEAEETKLPAPIFEGDEQANDAPIKGVLMMPPGSYNSLLTDLTSSNNLRHFQAQVEARSKWAKDSAIFRGECGMWRGVLVRKMAHTVYHDAGDAVKHVTEANKLTATETDVTVAAIGASHQVERSILLGAQALARVEGASASKVQAAIIENTYNAGRSYEYLGEFMGGERKFRFSFPNAAGDKEPTDNGVYVIDAIAPKAV